MCVVYDIHIIWNTTGLLSAKTQIKKKNENKNSRALSVQYFKKSISYYTYLLDRLNLSFVEMKWIKKNNGERTKDEGENRKVEKNTLKIYRLMIL